MDEQKHWRHSLHLLHEIWEEMDLDRDATHPSIAIFSINGSIKDF